ncbi:response regulator transcription factor [Ekhidna sp. To15]|uniref:response regulator transcription factor n=1 Tax=Ekhidna sp. To15 TaxID=3395267 RepID=UPI003F527785
MKILLLEDEEEIAKTIISYLQKEENTICDWATLLESGQEKVWNFEYDVILIDINLPDGNGLDLVQFIKEQRVKSGIIVVSARNSIGDRIRGLDLGADDYISKPFDLAELNARIKAVARRKEFDGDDKIQYGNISVIPFKKEVIVNGTTIKLTKKEYELLYYFISNPERIIAKETIAERLWGEYSYGADSFDFIYSHLKNLRKKIVENGGDDCIQTVYGLGYKYSKAEK